MVVVSRACHLDKQVKLRLTRTSRGKKELSENWFFSTDFSTGFLEVKGPKEMEMEEKDVRHP